MKHQGTYKGHLRAKNEQEAVGNFRRLPSFTFSSGETAEGRALQRYAQGPGIEPLAKMAEEIPPSAILLSAP